MSPLSSPNPIAARAERHRFRDTMTSICRFGTSSALALALVWLSVPGCKPGRASGQAPAESAKAVPSAVMLPSASPEPSANNQADATPAGEPKDESPAARAARERFAAAKTEGCPEGMVRVEGDYCPALTQECLAHDKDYDQNKDNPTVSERCLHYKKPSHCVSKQHEKLAFCMDRFEWPNKLGELPRVLTPWTQAKAMCEQAGKRLCTEDEFNFACEGPEMLPYAYGYDRDPTQCNIDKPYVQPDQSRRLYTYDKCMASDWCAAEIKRLDQRHAIGASLSCVSWSGIVDINGNVNEWVDLPGEKPPNRSGLKGGWWGPVRSRCRPTVTFHKEGDYGYEAGFRCCKNAEGAARGDGG